MHTLFIVIVTESIVFAFLRDVVNRLVTLEVDNVFVDLNHNDLNIDDQSFIECLHIRIGFRLLR